MWFEKGSPYVCIVYYLQAKWSFSCSGPLFQGNPLPTDLPSQSTTVLPLVSPNQMSPGIHLPSVSTNEESSINQIQSVSTNQIAEGELFQGGLNLPSAVAGGQLPALQHQLPPGTVCLRMSSDITLNSPNPGRSAIAYCCAKPGFNRVLVLYLWDLVYCYDEPWFDRV